MADKCIIEPERDCIGKTAALLLEKRIEDLEAWRDDSKKFHRDFYDWQRGQIARDARIDEQLSTMSKSLDKLVALPMPSRAAPRSVLRHIAGDAAPRP